MFFCLLALVALVILPFAVTLADFYITLQEFDGGWRTVNTTDPEIIKLAQFSVLEHNKEAKTNCTLRTPSKLALPLLQVIRLFYFTNTILGRRFYN
ncbi:hypothetical protein DVH24_016780 [Malus domestica]|uniref:Cystatin domain-containing protein n=1 Tax=Malus domestica TaxID=3750 RepID=A0A498HQZ0_MALDO|nr:hypothetical protein DVH24_016780 [Malus domestica]